MLEVNYIPLDNGHSYSLLASETSRVYVADILAQLTKGTDVILQASNDIIVVEAITELSGITEPAALTLQAGRSITLNQSISLPGDLNLLC